VGLQDAMQLYAGQKELEILMATTLILRGVCLCTTIYDFEGMIEMLQIARLKLKQV
jgi:hypothetical protein